MTCPLPRQARPGMAKKRAEFRVASKPDISLECHSTRERMPLVECCPLQVHLYFFGRPDLIGRHLQRNASEN